MGLIKNNFWKIYISLIIIYLVIGILILKLTPVTNSIVALTFSIIAWIYKKSNK